MHPRQDLLQRYLHRWLPTALISIKTIKLDRTKCVSSIHRHTSSSTDVYDLLKENGRLCTCIRVLEEALKEKTTGMVLKAARKAKRRHHGNGQPVCRGDWNRVELTGSCSELRSTTRSPEHGARGRPLVTSVPLTRSEVRSLRQQSVLASEHEQVRAYNTMPTLYSASTEA